MTKHYLVNNLQELNSVAEKLLIDFRDERVFALDGLMGAGKTTFTKSICHVLGAKDEVCSPTFAIVNEYLSETFGAIYHFDFYRINKESEAFDIGLEEYLYSGNYCFLEWSERIKNLLPKHYTIVKITEIEDNKREIIAERV